MANSWRRNPFFLSQCIARGKGFLRVAAAVAATDIVYLIRRSGCCCWRGKRDIITKRAFGAEKVFNLATKVLSPVPKTCMVYDRAHVETYFSNCPASLRRQLWLPIENRPPQTPTSQEKFLSFIFISSSGNYMQRTSSPPLSYLPTPHSKTVDDSINWNICRLRCSAVAVSHPQTDVNGPHVKRLLNNIKRSKSN